MNDFNKPIYVSINGETKSLRQWAMDSGVSAGTIYSRYQRGVRGKALIKPFVPIGIRNGNKKTALKQLWGKWVYVGTQA